MDKQNVQSEQAEDQGQLAQSEGEVQDQGVQNADVQSQDVAGEGNTEDQGTEEPIFMSKDDVPPELQKQWERMNKTFTAKMQGLSQDRKDAQAYRELQETQLRNAQARPQYHEQRQQLADEMGVDMNNLTPEQKATMEWLNGYVAKQVEQYIKPINQQIVQDRTAKELEQVRATYGDDFKQREPEIAMMIQKNPGLNFEQAYKVLTYDERENAGLQKAYANIENKKKAGVIKSTPSSAVAESPNLDDIASIYKSAKKQHGYS